MITKEEAAQALKRLARWANFFPKDDKDAVRELREALETADSPAIAEAVIDEWFREHNETPRPEQLRTMIFEKNAPKEIADPECKLCGGTGCEPVQRGMYSGVRDCSCRKVASKPPAQEKIESGLMRVASSGEVING